MDKDKNIGAFRRFFKACPYTFLLVLICAGMWYGKCREISREIDREQPVRWILAEVINIDDILGIDGIYSGVNDTSIADVGNVTDDDYYIPIPDEIDTGYEYGYWDENGHLNLPEGVLEQALIEAANAAMANAQNNAQNNSINDAQSNAGSQPEYSEPALPEVTELPEYDTSIYPYNQGTIQGNYVYYQSSGYSNKYCSDPGRIGLTSLAYYSLVDDTYFDDACFIGDSRMAGLFYYGTWGTATFFCDNGYCLNNYAAGKAVTCMNDSKKYVLDDALSARSYGKVYIMLGINDCGYGDTAVFKDRYLQMITMIRQKQPGAIIYLVANLNISQETEKNDKTGVFTNININDKNVAIADLADTSSDIYYLNYNAMFCDENGYLRSIYSYDGFHLTAEHYQNWSSYFKNHAIVK